MATNGEIQNTLDVSQLAYEIEKIAKANSHLPHDEIIREINDYIDKHFGNKGSKGLIFKDFQYDPKTGATIVAFENSDGTIILGVTGSQETWQDWIKTNGTLALTAGEVNIQLQALLDFVNKMKARYPDSTFLLTGHSLGGSGALILAYIYGINAIVYNAAPVGNIITDLFGPPDYAINFISEHDELNGVASKLSSHQKYKNIWLKNGKGHALDDLNVPWAIYAMSTILAVERGLLSKDHLIQFGIDLDGDGIPDTVIVREPKQTTPFNLLGKGVLSSNGSSGPIQISYDSLTYLANSVQGMRDTDIYWILKNVLISKDINHNIISKRETRAEQIIEKIDGQLRGFGIVNILQLIHSTFDRLTPQTNEGQYHLNLFESLGSCNVGAMLEPLYTIPNLELLKKGSQRFDFSEMGNLLTDIATCAKEIYETLTNDHVLRGTEHSLYDVPTITAHELSTFYETITPKITEVFQGLGNRSNFNDGIAQGLEKLLELLQNNVCELDSCLMLLAEMSNQLRHYFTSQDETLAKAIASKSSPQIEAIPSFDTREATLRESQEFEDMAVIKAKDEQIEKKGRELSNYLMEIVPLIERIDNRIYPYIELMRKLQGYLDVFLGQSDEKIIAEVRETYDEWKEVTYMDWEDYEEKKEWRWVEQERTKEIDFGCVGDIVGGHLAEMEVVYSANKTLVQDFEELSGTINAFTAQYDQTTIHAQRMIENAVYDAMGMSELVNIQKLSSQVIGRIMTQLQHVSQSLHAENKGVAIDTLISIVNKNLGAFTFYNLLLQTYFGNQI